MPYRKLLPIFFSFVILHSGIPVLHAQGFGQTREELEQSSKIAPKNNQVAKELRKLAFSRPSLRYDKEISLPFDSIIYENGTRCHEYNNRNIIGYFDKENCTIRATVNTPASGLFSLELIYKTLNPSPSPFVITLGNKTYDWKIEDSNPRFFTKTFAPTKLASGKNPFSIVQKTTCSSSLCIFSLRFIPMSLPDNQIILRPEGAWGASSCIREGKICVLKKFEHQGSDTIWEFDAPISGNYVVEVDYYSKLSSPNEFSISLPSTSAPTLRWKADSTQGKFMTKTAGVIEIDKGYHKLSLKSEKAIPEEEFGIFLVSLMPVSSADANLIEAHLLPENSSHDSPLPATAKQEPENKKSETDTTPSEKNSEPEQAEGASDQNSVSAIHAHFRKTYANKTKMLKDKYLDAQKKNQQKFSQSKNFKAVAAIQKILNSRDSATIPETSGVPNESAKIARIYIQQKDKLEAQLKASFLKTLQQQQMEYAEKNQFDKITDIQKMISVSKNLTPYELFSPEMEWSIPDIQLIGTWEEVVSKKANKPVSITIQPDGKGTCLYNGVKPDGYWGTEFIVKKEGNNQFIFFSPSAGSWIGQFHFLNEETFDMPWQGKSAIYIKKKIE